MKTTRWIEHGLRQAPVLLFMVVLAIFGGVAPNFLTAHNLVNIGAQAAPAGIVAIGMTFVLLTAGVDLSVGATMFVGAAVVGRMALNGQPFWLTVGVMLLIGLVFGAINAFLITWLRVAAFIVTLAMLFVGRGFALWLTQTRAMNLPEEFLLIGSTKVTGVPLPLMLFAGVAVFSHGVLKYTPFGRQVHAVGHSRDTARLAGIDTTRILGAVYLISGVCAALGGLLALGHLGAVTPKFGDSYEFKAIAAAVLGGTSLFGGRGAVLPGTVLGALLIQSVENGLVLLNADPYLYPVITSAIIFSAVLLDSLRNTLLARGQRRKIRRETDRGRISLFQRAR
jgi:ribose transport system permease protein